MFTVSNVLVALLGIASTAILARHLTTSEFGSYSFAVSFLAFVSLIFEFGLFTPAARLTAVADSQRQRDILGAALVAYAPVGVLFVITVFGLSFVVDHTFQTHAGTALRIAAPVAIAVPFTLILQQLTQGLDRLHIASISALAMQVLLVCLLVIAISIEIPFDVTAALLIRCTCVVAATAAAVFWLRPTFRAVGRLLSELARHAREYGFHIYVGRLLSIGTYNMDVLMLAAFASAQSVGFYTLAAAVAFAAGLPVLGMATALFAPMARVDKIRTHWLVVAAFVATVTTLAAWLLAGPFIEFAFSDRYSRATRLVLPLALAQAVRGVTTVFNTFLTAHGRGRELRNAGLVLTASNLVLNFALIPPFGAMGAAWASLLALIANFVAHVVSYRSSIKAGVRAET